MTDDNGLQYLRARYYDPSVGMFTSRDPVMGVAGGSSITFNPYAYAGANPTNYVDPSGEAFWIPLLIGAGIFAGGAGIDAGFQMALEGRSFDEVNWLRAGISGGTALLGGVAGFGIRQLGLAGARAFAAGAITDISVGIAADHFVLGDDWGTAGLSNIIGFGLGEYVGDRIARSRILRNFADGIVNGSGREVRQAVLSQLRNFGNSSPSYPGFILDTALEENVQAISAIRARLRSINPDAIIGMERGGTFLAEAVTYGDNNLSSRVVRIGKISKSDETAFINAFASEINNLLESGQRNIVFVDTYFGGPTSRGVNGAFRRLSRSFPDARFTSLWLRETMGLENDVIQGFISPSSSYAGRIVNQLYSVRVAVGDDMDIILNGSNHALRIFNTSGRVTRTIRPGIGTARDALIRVLNGY